MRAVGRIEGGIDGINKRLDFVNGRLNKSEDNINDLQSFNDNLKGKITAWSVLGGAAITGIWEFFKSRVL